MPLAKQVVTRISKHVFNKLVLRISLAWVWFQISFSKTVFNKLIWDTNLETLLLTVLWCLHYVSPVKLLITVLHFESVTVDQRYVFTVLLLSTVLHFELSFIINSVTFRGMTIFGTSVRFVLSTVESLIP